MGFCSFVILPVVCWQHFGPECFILFQVINHEGLILFINRVFTVVLSGLIRCLAVSPGSSTLGVGLSSGVLSMVDLSSGLLLGGWRAHDGEVMQVRTVTTHNSYTCLKQTCLVGYLS